MKAFIFSLSLLATSSFASERSSDKCDAKAVEAALAIAKINGAKEGGAMFPTTVFTVEPLGCGEEYSSRSLFRVGNADHADGVYFSYQVEIGVSKLGGDGDPCEVISVAIPLP